MNKTMQRTAMLLLPVLALGGCKRYEPVLPPNIKLNPNPVEKYKVVLEVNDPPESMRIAGSAVFAMRNGGRCVPVDSRRSLGGSRPIFGKEIEIPVVRVSDDLYEMYFYGDSIISEDYYGEGVCNWQGAPSYTIRSAGAKYLIAGRWEMSEGGVTTFACPKKNNGSGGGCVQEQYVRDLNNSTHFLVKLTILKE